MKQLRLDPAGKTEVVKNFPNSFPGALTARGELLVYTRENSEDFEYIGMPIGGIGAGQLYLGGDGQLWFWDISGLSYKKGQLKGEEAYEFPYKRSKPNEAGARMAEQGFSISVKSGDQWITKTLNRDGIRDIEFLGQYPIGEVTYRDPDLPVDITLEAFSPFIPLDLENSILPATVMSFSVRNTSDEAVEAAIGGWLGNAVLAGSREDGIKGMLKNRAVELPDGGLRLECAADVDGARTRSRG